MAEEKKVVEEGTQEKKLEVKHTDMVVAEDGKGKKALKWVFRGLAVVASGLVGFFIGRATNSSDDEESEDSNEAEQE